MPTFSLICPHCGCEVRKSLIFDKKGHASRGSGICNKCRKPIAWWGENGRPKIAKN